MFAILTTQVKRAAALAVLVPVLAACGGAGTATAPTSGAAGGGSTAATSAPAAEATSAPAATTMTEVTAAPEATSSAGASATTSAGASATSSAGGAMTMPAITPRAVTASLTGSGASFPDPIYQQWVQQYQGVASGVTINYQSVGSGQGRKDFFNGVTDFGGTDKFASDDELSKYGKPVYHVPTVLGAVVTPYNLAEVSNLQFSGETLAKIFLGEVTKWNAPEIAADNPGVTLPDKNITVVHRSDGSGTTSIFTNYLSSVSADWKSKVGAGDSVEWPVGIGGEKNPGVAQAVQQTDGAIGYVELIYALGNKLPAPKIKNASGAFIDPTLESVSAAAAAYLPDTPDDLRVNIVNPPAGTPEGEAAYPISGYTWILVNGEMADEAKAQALTDFLYWSLTEGEKSAADLGFAPLPDSVREKAVAALTKITVNGQPAFSMPQ